MRALECVNIMVSRADDRRTPPSLCRWQGDTNSPFRLKAFKATGCSGDRALAHERQRYRNDLRSRPSWGLCSFQSPNCVCACRRRNTAFAFAHASDKREHRL